ncbi:3-dehydroquinate synthase [Buchnera aphidicola]|uniref:3-dehydroquinate synthase n=1 Tax=Buchnera aphidicola TaxID=9 RepID=UPI0031B86A85
MKKIDVNLNDRSYSIFIGSNIFIKKNIFNKLKFGKKVLLITNFFLFNLYKKKILKLLNFLNIKVDKIIIKDNEKFKSFKTVKLIIKKLLKKKHTRETTLISLGGGVIGDITGFVASIYQRGVKFIQIPTTLLSQVDASIGGKTGINHKFGKNMIGTFWQPISVWIDLNILKTLPKKQLISGLAEVIKYAIIFDKKFFKWLENNILNILKLKKKYLMYCIKKCCKLKSSIISSDEFDYGNRALLNFGHTFGHAIESYFNYEKWLHGEAVSLGMVVASYISEFLGYLKHSSVNRIINLLKKVGLPVNLPKDVSYFSYFPYIIRDKKNTNGIVKFILPLSLGKAKIFNNINKNIIIAAIKKCK